jgi:hypothetical protein
MKRSEKGFWLLFILLNILQFLPAYLVNADTSSFLPIHSFLEGKWYFVFKTFFKRYNFDIFRLSLDLSILACLFYFFRNKISIRLFSILSAAYFLILIIFLVYFNLMQKIYLVEPIIYNDLYLLKLGFHNLNENIILLISSIFLIIALLYFVFYLIFFKLFQNLRNVAFGKTSRIIIYTTGFFVLFNTIKSGITFDANHEFQIGLGLIIDNLQRSSETAESISKLNIDELNKLSGTYKSFTLKSYPDIYFLFVESYGNIVYQDSVFKEQFIETTGKCNKELLENGWYATSDLSVSPISGGGSWISFSSVLFGVNFKNQGSYLFMLRNPEINKYTHVFRYFQNQGYKSYWINPLPENSNLEIPWKLYTAFYSVDKWINYKDLNYEGILYGFGPSPPDQFSLFKAQQIIEQDTNTRHIVFYITHNSHNPFLCPDSVVQNWQSLNTGSYSAPQPSLFLKKPKAVDYIKSIDYEIKALVKFINRKSNKEAIYIIIGDHQPPILTSEKNGFETPVHIVSTDSTFIHNFRRYGFTDGLLLGNNFKKIRHESIYSMLMREIIRQYGTKTDVLPDYLFKGFETK